MDVFQVRLYSQNFEIEWQQCFGGSEDDLAKDITIFNNGYLVVGGTGSNDGDISYYHGNGDGWIIRIDNNGNILWEKTYGGSDLEYFNRIIPSSDNKYYLLGLSFSSDGDISNDPYPDTPDYWIVKIDSAGTILWDKIVGGNAGELLWTGAPTLDGGVVAIGWTYSNDGDVSINYGGADTWMVKISSDGELEWDFTIGTDFIDKGQAILQTSDGGYLAASSSMLGEGGNITCEPHSYMAEAVLTKLDANRNIEWQNCYGGTDHDGITSLIEVDDGYVFGAYVNSNDGDIAGWHGENDIWIVKIDYFGNIIWQKCLGGTRSEFTSKLLISDNDDIIITGYTQSNNGDVSGNHTLSEYDYDIWLVKLNSEGELISQQCIGGAGSEELYFGVIKKSDNNFVIAGKTDYGPSYDVQCTPHGSLPDEEFWVFEIKDTTVGIQQTHLNEALKAYPNPANKYVIFDLHINTVIPRETTVGSDEACLQGRQKSPQHNQQSPQITITNTLGQRVAQVEVKSNKTVWDTRSVQAGVYFYFLEIDRKRYSGKVVIQK